MINKKLESRRKSNRKSKRKLRNDPKTREHYLEMHRKDQKLYRKNHPEKIKEYKKKWNENNPHYRQEYDRNYRNFKKIQRLNMNFQKLYDYMRKKMQMQHIYQPLESDLKGEVKSHIRIWKKRWDSYQQIGYDSSLIHDNV